ncbi:MAG TPA: cyclic nucleotide-binding domain-containing protein [Chitinophagaceae bacterium]|nr:cyclic nucleotide-binding domain-containing protein [Chitinophagaceae bacterium]
MGFYTRFKKNKQTKGIPFIFLTSKAEREDVRRGMELGADDYITKPFSSSELLNAVEARFKKMEEIKGAYNQTAAPVDISIKTLLEQFTAGRNVNRYKNKQVVFSEGNRPTCIYWVKSGKVKTFKTNEDGKELVMGLYRPGDFLGYVALLEKSNYQETAEAIETSEIIVISKPDFDALLTSHPEINGVFLEMLAKDVVEKENQLLGLAYNSLRQKVATALLTFYKTYKTPGNKAFNIDISRENLATLAGTATESLIRTLADFKNEKVIDVTQGSISIPDAKGLKDI